MLVDPAILFLDEATSSVDTTTEARIQRSLERLLAGRTSFIVAHRLSTIRHADLVLEVSDRPLDGRPPDPDDAFMFYALATRKIPTGNLRFEHVLQDIETLNQKALDGVCNKYGQTHDVANLFISDGSQFTTSGAENPTLTIVALAIRQADYLADQLSKNQM